jgi:site-specific DNA recombinase
MPSSAAAPRHWAVIWISAARPFDVILLDDSSRLARNTKDALSIFERLNFAGIRLIAVSQGIDSDNEQAHFLRFVVYAAGNF